jgi:hypothetical protein
MSKEIRAVLNNSRKIAKESRIAFDNAIDAIRAAQKEIRDLLN